MKWTLEKKMYAGFGAALLLLAVVSVISYVSTARVIENYTWALHSNEVIREVRDLNFRLYAAESGQRSFILTGKPTFLDSYQATIEAIRRDIRRLGRLLEGNARQQQRFDQLELLLAKRSALLKEWIRLQRNKGSDAAMEVIMRDEGKKIADDILRVVTDMEKDENELLRRRMESAELSARSASFVMSFGSLMAFLLFIVAAYIIQKDLIERKRMEDSLQQSQREVSTLLDSMPAYVFFKDAKSNYVTANKKFCEAVGYTKREIVRKTDYDLYGRDVAIKARADDARVIMAGEPLYVGEEGFVEAGRSVTVATRKVPLKNERGSVVGLIGLGFDITEIKHAQKALRESEERFRNVFTRSPIGIQLYDADGGLIDANSACFGIFGVASMDEMKGLKLLEEPFVDWETSKKMKAGESVEFEVEFDFDALRETGRLAGSRTGDCYLHCLMAPLGLDDSGRYRVLVEVQDITERKLADERIRASLHEKEVLLKEIHHRVKNNLQIISSLLNLQSKYIKDVSAIEMFKESRNRIRSMTLIHEKLYRSKDLAHIDLPEYIQNLSSNLFRSYNSGSVTLKTQIDDILLGIDTAIPCGLIINELVSNSLKHAFPEHRGEITVSLLWNDPNYTLMVKDTGKGFPADVDFRNTESLGLQLVCTLTEQLSGEIVLDRSNGTAWSITFQELKYKERA